MKQENDRSLAITDLPNDVLNMLAESMDWASLRNTRHSCTFFLKKEALAIEARRKHPFLIKAQRSNTFLAYKDLVLRSVPDSPFTQLPDETLKMLKEAGGVVDILTDDFKVVVRCVDRLFRECEGTFLPYLDELKDDFNRAGGIIMISMNTVNSLIQCKEQIFVQGQNEFGQLGLGHRNFQRVFQPLPEKTMNLFKEAGGVVKVFLSYSKIIVWCKTTIFVTGHNTCSELGLGHNQDVDTFAPLPQETLDAFENAGGIVQMYVENGHILVQCKYNFFIREACNHTQQFWFEKENSHSFHPFSKESMDSFDAAEGITKVIVGTQCIAILCKKALFLCERREEKNKNPNQFAAIPQGFFESFEEAGGIINIFLGNHHLLVQCREQWFLRGKLPGSEEETDSFTPILSSEILEQFNQAGGIVRMIVEDNFLLVQSVDGVFVYGDNSQGQLGFPNTNIIDNFSFLPYSTILENRLEAQSSLKPVGLEEAVLCHNKK